MPLPGPQRSGIIMRHFLEFEKPIAELEGKIAELRHLNADGEVNIEEEISKLQAKVDRQIRTTYSKLTAWQKTLVARHPDRPHFLDYVAGLITDFTPLAGDRVYGDDSAVLGGLGRFRGRSVMVIGTEKGKDTETRVKHRFGAGYPEGYRKARRLMEMADRFRLPVITFVDTAGAFPGIEAEQRGQAEAIARSIEACLALRTPLVSVIVGEGGSGGAIALATGNRVYMLEHSIYSVISPEGCASILWRSAANAQDAAEALKLTAQDLLQFRVIDGIIEEPLGGAHRNPEAAIQAVGDRVEQALAELSEIDGGVLRARRKEKFLDMHQTLAA
jgi:acetyl-CoA carboxylase carboxyl transferase subunit alpha